MDKAVTKVAVVGSGISGAVCASILARNGVSVTLFESARGPGGRMSQRREILEDGRELLFDHGAPYFTVTNNDVLALVQDWELRGIVAEWKVNFSTFDFASKKFIDTQQDGLSRKYVGVPGMNSICEALCLQPGVESKFRMGVRKLEWLEDENIWSVMGLDGQTLGRYNGLVVSDKIVASPRFRDVTGRPPPLDLTSAPQLAATLEDIPVIPRFALMLAFAEPLSSIPVKGFSVQNSQVLSWAHCDSIKPERSTTTDRWVLHSTMEYAKGVISETGFQKPSDATLFQKPSDATLIKVAEEMFQEFQGLGFSVLPPIFRKAHRWGSAFPNASVAKEEKCLWDSNKRLAICGDFCVSPNVEGAILSGLAAASKLTQTPSYL